MLPALFRAATALSGARAEQVSLHFGEAAEDGEHRVG
jgi:hypothetical protein